MRQDDHGDREHRVHEPGPEDRDDDDREQQARQRQDDVHQPHDRDLGHAAEEAGDEAERDPDDDRQRDDRDADQERQPRAVDQPRQDVAADRVGAERIGPRAAFLPRRRLQEHRVVGEIGRVGREHVGERRHQQHGDDDHEPRRPRRGSR